MNPAFLILANVCLFTRLLCLFRDDVADARVWRIKTLAEVGAATVLFPFGLAWLVVILTLVGFNYAGFRAERRSGRKDFTRLVLGALELGVLSLWLSVRLGPGLRPELASALEALGRWTAFTPFVALLHNPRVQLYLFGLLVVANESNLFIRAILNWPGLKLNAVPATNGGVEEVGEFNRGRMIGILERVLVYGFVLQAQYGAIGFILAAKAFARFKALDKRDFAEYVLIGTLLSATMAIATGGMIRWLLAH